MYEANDSHSCAGSETVESESSWFLPGSAVRVSCHVDPSVSTNSEPLKYFHANATQAIASFSKIIGKACVLFIFFWSQESVHNLDEAN